VPTTRSLIANTPFENENGLIFGAGLLVRSWFLANNLTMVRFRLQSLTN